MTETFAYSLVVDSDLSEFLPEIEFVFDFLDETYGLVRVAEADRKVQYGGRPNQSAAGTLFIPAALFSQGVSTDEQGIWPKVDALRKLEDGGTFLPGREGRVDYDAPGLIFHQLSRIEERVPAEHDSYDRFPFDQTLAARIGRYDDPLADRAAMDLARAITGDPARLPLGEYKVMLTHDVDKLRGYNYAHEPIRYALGDVLKRAEPGRALKRLYRGYFAGLPWSSLNEMMSLSEAHGVKSEFYFIGPSLLAQDTPYGVTMPDLVKRAADAIRKRGHIIGFHPGHRTCRDQDAWLRQKAALEDLVGGPLTRGRQHRLEYDFSITPDIWDAAGMEMDCTPAFPQATGFRTGSCRPHRAYSLRQRRALGLRLVSTPIQDFAYFSNGKYRDLSCQEALEEASSAINVCRRYRGTLSVLQHLGQVTEPARGFYRELVGLCFGDSRGTA
ncbi:MAG: hypothetical protein R8L07_12535 [Alphaproteobacteria bacterium]|nr:hypothetical protein [Alphaproteobacteria bacterium]